MDNAFPSWSFLASGKITTCYSNPNSPFVLRLSQSTIHHSSLNTDPKPSINSLFPSTFTDKITAILLPSSSSSFDLSNKEASLMINRASNCSIELKPKMASPSILPWQCQHQQPSNLPPFPPLNANRFVIKNPACSYNPVDLFSDPANTEECIKKLAADSQKFWAASPSPSPSLSPKCPRFNYFKSFSGGVETSDSAALAASSQTIVPIIGAILRRSNIIPLIFRQQQNFGPVVGSSPTCVDHFGACVIYNRLVDITSGWEEACDLVDLGVATLNLNFNSNGIKQLQNALGLVKFDQPKTIELMRALNANECVYFLSRWLVFASLCDVTIIVAYEKVDSSEEEREQGDLGSDSDSIMMDTVDVDGSTYKVPKDQTIPGVIQIGNTKYSYVVKILDTTIKKARKSLKNRQQSELRLFSKQTISN